jgi:hypothetical protein
MIGRTIEDLTTIRAQLVERRRQQVYWITGAYHGDQISKAVEAHLAIQAIDAVIAEGLGEPQFELGDGDLNI